MKKIIYILAIIATTFVCLSCNNKERTIEGTYEFDTEFVQASMMQSLLEEGEMDDTSKALAAIFVAPMVKVLYNTIEFTKDGKATIRDASGDIIKDGTYRATRDSVFINDYTKFAINKDVLIGTDGEMTFKYNLMKK